VFVKAGSLPSWGLAARLAQCLDLGGMVTQSSVRETVLVAPVEVILRLDFFPFRIPFGPNTRLGMIFVPFVIRPNATGLALPKDGLGYSIGVWPHGLRNASIWKY
jgi:hypothetical protein